MNELVPIRVLQDPAIDGPTNMARDEVLLSRVGQGASPPTLRLYQWTPPTISLGYFQRYAEYESLPSPAGELAVVRRLTGGGAILHDLELTYSLILPVNHILVAGGPERVYELAHDAVEAALRELKVDPQRCGVTDDSTPAHGPFFCFARRHRLDVLIGNDKVAGSAQRRTRTALLQHGSIIVGNRYPQQTTAHLKLRSSSETCGHDPPLSPHGKGEYRGGTRHPIMDDTLEQAKPRGLKPAAQCTGTGDASAAENVIGRLRSAFVEYFADTIGQRLERDEWTANELADVAPLIEKYAGPDWTRRR